MPVKYILSQAGKKLGLTNTAVGSNDRLTLLRYLNEAAMELYDQSDMAGSLMEQVFKVNGDQTITVPWYVAAIRGVREYASMQNWHINRMRTPRYHQFNWVDMWRNIRIRNTQALQASLTNQCQLVVSTPVIESPPLTVSLSGPSLQSSNYIESLALDNKSIQFAGGFYKITNGTYLDVTSITKSAINLYDVLVSDIDFVSNPATGNQLVVVPNCRLDSTYQVWDVSSCPWLPQNTSVLDNYLEILFKRSLPYLFNDEDTFLGMHQYDNILVNKIMELYFEEQKNPTLATLYDGKATRSLARKQLDENKASEDIVSLVANPHDTMLKRIGSGLRRRYSLYAGRKY
jgi:hypothetical protein